MKIIKGNLTLKENTIFNEDLKVEGDIICEGGYYNLKVEGDIICGNIICGDINCGDIDCWDINCRNIICGNIICGEIDCEDINCGNINSWKIECRDISYYAVCFAYKNIKCKSIKGRRKNSRHFALDGKITINKEELK